MISSWNLVLRLSSVSSRHAFWLIFRLCGDPTGSGNQTQIQRHHIAQSRRCRRRSTFHLARGLKERTKSPITATVQNHLRPVLLILQEPEVQDESGLAMQDGLMNGMSGDLLSPFGPGHGQRWPPPRPNCCTSVRAPLLVRPWIGTALR